jgi:hypothetical protein
LAVRQPNTMKAENNARQDQATGARWVSRKRKWPVPSSVRAISVVLRHLVNCAFKTFRYCSTCAFVKCLSSRWRSSTAIRHILTALRRQDLTVRWVCPQRGQPPAPETLSLVHQHRREGRILGGQQRTRTIVRLHAKYPVPAGRPPEPRPKLVTTERGMNSPSKGRSRSVRHGTHCLVTAQPSAVPNGCSPAPPRPGTTS